MTDVGLVARARGTLWVPGRRWITLLAVAGILAAIGATALVASVGKVDTDEAVVYFVTQPTPTQVATVRRECPGFGKATLEPPAKNTLASTLRYPIRYSITYADARDKAQLYECLHLQNVNVSEFRSDG